MKLKLMSIILLVTLLMISGAIAVTTISYNYDDLSENISSYYFPIIINTENIIVQVSTTSENLICKYSKDRDKDFNQMEGTFDFSYNNLHKKSFGDLVDGVYKIYIKCKNSEGNITKEVELSFGVSIPVSARISLSKNNTLSAGMVKVNVITSKILSQKPSLTYSLNGVNYDPIPLTGSNSNWYGYLYVADNQGEAAGSFKFRGIDIDGNIGEEITSGEIFLIDTTKPSGINNIRVLGESNGIKIEWYDDQETEEFKIYRSTNPGVDYSDYYERVDEKEFTDKNVDKGRIYYYKISAIDKAGNEGPLSFEFSSNSLLSDTNTSGINKNSLDNELIATIDGFLMDLDLVKNDIIEIKERISSGQKELYEDLKLGTELDNANNELNSLNQEVEGYKSQTLTRSEVDRKITNAKLRLNVIKKRIPESMTILNNVKSEVKYSEDKLREILVNLYPGDENKIQKIIRLSSVLNEKNLFLIKNEGYNLEINYLDGSKKTSTLIISKINDGLGEMNASTFLYIPKDIVESAKEIEFKNPQYEILKEDPIISFPLSVNKMVYVLGKNIDLTLINRISAALVEIPDEEVSMNSPTGFFSSIDLSGNGNYSIYFGLMILIGGLVTYYVFVRKSSKDIKNLDEISSILIEARVHKQNQDKKNLDNLYTRISGLYKELGKNEKEQIYPAIKAIFDFNK